MLHTIELAVKVYREDNKAFMRLVRRAMNGQYGWDKSALVYIDVYKSLLPEVEAPAEAEEEAAEETAVEETKAE